MTQRFRRLPLKRAAQVTAAVVALLIGFEIALSSCGVGSGGGSGDTLSQPAQLTQAPTK